MPDAHFKIVHSVLDADAIAREVDARYALDGPAYGELMHRGMNDIYIVRTPRSQYALRAWRADWRSMDDVAYELEFLCYLRDRGLPIAPPVAAQDGSLYFTAQAPEGARALALFQWAPGRKFGAAPSAENAFAMGEIFGRIHTAARDFTPSRRRRTNTIAELRGHGPHLLRLVGDRPEDAAYYPLAMERLCSALEELDPAITPVGTNHGDFHFNNVHIGEDGHITILDFDNAGEDYFLQDVMCYVWANGYAGLDQIYADRFIEGYEAARPVSAEERAFMPLFLLAKEFRLLAGAAAHVNSVGRLGLRFRSLDWFSQSIRRHMADAGLA